MGTTYDIPGIGRLKLGEIESSASRMSTSALQKHIESGDLPDPVMAVLRDELNKRGKKKGGLVEKKMGPGGKQK